MTRCPYCDSSLRYDASTKLYRCVRNGPLLPRGEECQLRGQSMTREDLDKVAIFLIDNDGGD